MREEFDCVRCGIRVVHAVPQPDEVTHCTGCAFIEGIGDPEARRQVAEALDRTNPMFAEEQDA